MPLTLEEVVYKIKGDTADFTTAMKAVQKTSDDTHKQIKAGFESLSGPVKAITGGIDLFKGGLAALGVVAAASLVKKTLEGAEAIQTLSDNTGVGTKMLQELGYAATQSGIKQEELNGALMILNRNLGQAQAGSEEAVKKFEILGKGFGETALQGKSTQEVFGMVADRVKKAGNESERAAILTEVFGRSGARLGVLMKDGSEGLNKFGAEAKALGIVIDEDLIKGAADAADKMEAFEKVISAQVMTAIVQLAPEINSLVSGMIKLASYTASAVREMGNFYQSMKLAMGGTVSHAAQVRLLKDNIESLESKIKAANDSQSTSNKIAQFFGATTFLSAQAVAELKKQLEASKASLATLTAEESKSTKVVQGKTNAIAEQRKAVDELHKMEERGKQILKDENEKDPQKKYAAELKALETYQKKVGKDDQQFADAKKRLAKDLYDSKQELALKEVDKLQSQNENMRKLDEAKYQDDIKKNNDKINQIITQEGIGSETAIAIKAKQKEREDQIDKERLQAGMDALNALATFQNYKSKEMQIVGKAAAIAQATISTYTGATGAFAALSGIPIVGPALGFAAAAAIVAAGLANVATIGGVQLAEGGTIPGTRIGDHVPAILEPGETVIKKETTTQLVHFLNDQSGTQKILMSIDARLRGMNSPSILKIGDREVARSVNRAIRGGMRIGL